MTEGQQGPRPLHVIADEISRTWRNPHYTAAPYIRDMRYLGTMEDHVGSDDAVNIVLRFLGNAGTWRGEDAKRIKAELNGMLPERYRRKR